MKLPPSYVAAGPPRTNDSHVPFWLLPSSSGEGKYTENWSSLIGIITAIIGNVLISFALNTQRYAHIRLEREWQEEARRRKRESQTTSPGARADVKSGQQYDSPPLVAYTDDAERVDGNVVANEADPLLPAKSSRSRPTLISNNSSASAAGVPEDAYKQKSYLKSPYWWAGIILMTIGEAGNFLAYGFAPASIVSPLGVVALISNCMIAPFMLKEPFRMRDGLGVLVAVGGAVTVVFSASDNNPKLGPEEIWDLIRRWEFETYLAVTVAVIVTLMVASNRFGDKNILVDLGLVGLFGMPVMSPTTTEILQSADQDLRRLYSTFHQGCSFSVVLHPLARHYLPGHLSTCRYSSVHSHHADQIRQPGPPTLRCYPGHPRAVRLIHLIGHSRIRNPVPRLRTHVRRRRRQIRWRMRLDLFRRLVDHKRAATK
jgi:drug/metabolite transporter (DMT)-like permease